MAIFVPETARTMRCLLGGFRGNNAEPKGYSKDKYYNKIGIVTIILSKKKKNFTIIFSLFSFFNFLLENTFFVVVNLFHCLFRFIWEKNCVHFTGN